MRSLPELLDNLSAPPRRALFLAFDLNTAFFDHDVLTPLLTDALIDVTVIVDSLTIAGGASDVAGTRKAGVYYRIEGVRPRAGGLFHPKLAVLQYDDGVDVIIGSANLTWTGWCRNLEIIDCLSFGPKGNAPPEAARNLADFLRKVSAELNGLSAQGLRNMQVAADALDRAADQTDVKVTEGMIRIASSIEQPLIRQLAQWVPAADVTQVVAISPFFDPANDALQAIARAFPAAQLQVIKDGLRSNDFDGKAYAKIGKRATLLQTQWEEGARPLHAKALFLESSRTTWFIAGSANLTTPAWLRSTKEGGNVELVVAREASGPPKAKERVSIGAKQLLVDVPTLMVPDPSVYSFGIDVADSLGAGPNLHILTAEEEERRLQVRWGLQGATSTDATVVLTLRSQDREARGEFPAHFAGELWTVDVILAHGPFAAVLDDEIAAIIEIRHQTSEGTVSGSAWLRRTGLLGQAPRTLLLRQQIRALTQLSSGRPEDLLLGIGALLEAAQRDEGAFDLRGRPDEDDGPPTSDEDGSERRSPLRTVVRAFVIPALSGQRPKRVASRTRGPRIPTEQDEEEDAADDEEQPPAPDLLEMRRERATRLADSLERLHAVMFRYLERCEANPSKLDVIMSTAGALLSGLQVAALSLRQEWLRDLVAMEDEVLRTERDRIQGTRRALWQMAFSLDGWEAGHCQGWFPRMAQTEAWTALASATLQKPSLLARVLLDLVFDGGVDAHASLPAESRFVLQRLSGRSVLAEAELLERMQRLAEDEYIFPDDVELDRWRAMLAEASLSDLVGWRRMQTWSPIVEFVAGRLSADGALASMDSALSSAFSGLLRRPNARPRFTAVRIENHAVLCGACNTVLAPRKTAELRRPIASLVHCESCGGVLMPIDPNSPTLAWLQETGDGHRHESIAHTA